MNRIKKAPGANRGNGQASAGGAIEVQVYCTSYNIHLSSLIYQASQLMDAAEARADSDLWVAHFTIWLSLLSAKHGLPWPGTVARG